MYMCRYVSVFKYTYGGPSIAIERIIVIVWAKYSLFGFLDHRGELSLSRPSRQEDTDRFSDPAKEFK